MRSRSEIVPTSSYLVAVPNGHVHDPSLDVLHWRFTEQGYPPVHERRFDNGEGLALAQLVGVRGYAPLVDLSAIPARAPHADDLASIQQEATDLVNELAALLSDPEDPLDRTARGMDYLWLWPRRGWVIAFGWNVYLRDVATGWRDVTPGLASFSRLERESLATVIGRLRSGIGPDGLMLPRMTALDSVIDVSNADEILCTSARLTGTLAWDLLAGRSVFDWEVCGRIVHELREVGVDLSHDQTAVRWHR
jgi:hypothetical protein